MVELKEELKSEVQKISTNTNKKNTIIIKENHIGKAGLLATLKNIFSQESCDKAIEIILSNEQNSLSNISEINHTLICA